MTAPDIPGRLRALRDRGGRLVVVDPRRTKTAEEADEYVAIRPGTDALFLFGIVHVLFADELVELGAVAGHVDGLDERARARRRVHTGARRRRVRHRRPARFVGVAHELASAPTAAVYARMGSCTQEFGTLASWLVDVVNICTGNLDRPGGAMFTNAATSTAVAGASGEGPRRQVREADVARARLARDLRRAARGVSRGRDRDAGRGPDPRDARRSAATRRRRPPTSNDSRARSAASTSWSASTCTSTRRRVTPT